MRFDKPVRVATGPAGNIAITVSDAEGAARFLLERWPVEPGSRHKAARRAVLAALERAHDPVQAERARRAFAAAADEAAILMPDWPQSEAPAGFKSPSWSRSRQKS